MTIKSRCTKCIIDGGGALPAAAVALAIVSDKMAEADNAAFPDLTEEEQDHLQALSELDCRRAAKIREWTDQMRLARTAIYGGEYDEETGGYEIHGLDGVRKKAPVTPT